MASVNFIYLLLAMCFSMSLAQDGYQTYPTVPESRFRLYSFSRTWVQALSLCQEDGNGAHLVVINSQAEADVVTKLFEQIEDPLIPHLAIGIDDIATEGSWVTVFGELVSASGYDSWAPEEPNGGSDENCGVINRLGNLNSAYCANERPFICEKSND